MRWTLLVFALVGVSDAQPWRYTDDRGQVHWTNDVYQLPPRLRDRALAKIKAKQKLTQESQKLKQKTDAPPGFRSSGPAEFSKDVFAAPKAKPRRKAKRQLAPEPKAIDWDGRVAKAQAKTDAAQSRFDASQKELQAAQFLLATVPSGPAYARRNKALDEDKASRAALKSSKADLEKTKFEAARSRR